MTWEAIAAEIGGAVRRPLPTIGPDSRLEDLGLDSLEFIEVLGALGAPYSPEVMAAETVSDLAAVLAAA